MNFKVNMIACGGTALTLLDIKESTKDVDFIIPLPREYHKLYNFLKNIGYIERGGGLAHDNDPLFMYQFWTGSNVFTTELLCSPLEEGRNILIKKLKHIYLGALNLNDLIMTKIFRGTSVDVEDCLAVFQKTKVNPYEVFQHYKEAAQYDLNPDKVMGNFIVFVERLYSENIVSDDFLQSVKQWE